MYIVVSDTDSGHASGIASDILSYCPTATIETRIELFGFTVAYALTASAVDGVVRATTGLNDARIAEIKTLWDIGKFVIHAHGSNSNILISDPTYLGEAIIARAPGTSYGPGIEITVASGSTQSDATGYLGGMFAQTMIQNSWNLETTRQALREKSDNWGTGWNQSTGFGSVDFLQAISGSNTYLLNTVTSISGSDNGNYNYQFDFTNISSSYIQELVVFSTSGSISSSFSSGIKLYDTIDTGSTYIYPNTTFTGSLVFGVYSSGSSPQYSRLESYSLSSLNFSYSTVPIAKFAGSGSARFYKSVNYTPGTKIRIF